MWAVGVDGASVDVQMGFGSAPGIALGSVTWTSIVNDVRSLSFDYGKSDPLDSYQAGRLSMVLGNAHRHFDPLNTAGPYYGNLKPMCRIRVLHTYGGTTVTKWTGYVSGWPQTYDPPNDATVVVNATDGFAVLQRARLNDAYWHEVKSDTPTYWYRLGESAGTTAIDASGNGRDGLYYNGPTFNSRTGLIVGSDNAIEFKATQYMVPPYIITSVPFTIEFWMQRATTGNTEILFLQASLLNAQTISISMDTTGHLSFLVTDGVNTQSFTATAATIGDGGAHHVVCVCNSGASAPTVYIDGTSAAGTTGSGAISLTSTSWAIEVRGPIADSGGNPVAAGDIILDEFAAYGSALSSARALAHYNAGHAPFSGVDTGAAVTTILGYAGWPSADETIETGHSTLTTFNISGQTALDAIKTLETTEQGRCFMANDGKATFYNRHHTLTTSASTTSQATFGDAPGELKYRDVGFDYGEEKIRNKITTSRAGGSPYVAIDATSVTDYLEREFTISGLYNSSDDEIRDLGLWHLSHYKDPQTRIPGLNIQPRSEPANLFPHIRDRKLLDRVTVKRRPQSVGPTISVDALIEGIHHEITVSPLDWNTTYYVSPADPQIYLILDDTTYGILDTARLAF